MEHPVYDIWARRTGLLLGGVYLLPIAGLTIAVASKGHGIPDDLIYIDLILGAVGLALGCTMHACMSARVRIDMAERRVVHSFALFGITLRRIAADLGQFDHISLHRLYRGGYRASLIGREKEVTLAISTNLGRVRTEAQEAATLTGLRLADGL